MIAANPGWSAMFHNEEDDDRFLVRVEAWSQHGAPMVVDVDRAALVVVGQYSAGKFVNLVFDGEVKK